MEDYRQIIESAEPGQIIPIVKQIRFDDPVDFFARVSDYGRAEDCCLFESREYLAGKGALSFGTGKPALYVTGKQDEFLIKALNQTGRRMLAYLASPAERFAFCETVDFGRDRITGTIKHVDEVVDEQTRLNCTNQMDMMRVVAFSFRLATQPFRVTCGLLGALSYDFIDQFEKIPQNTEDLLGNPDYELYFADNIFLMDHEENAGYVVVNCIVTDEDREQILTEAQACFDYYENMARFDAPKAKSPNGTLAEASTDTDQATYEGMVAEAKKHIVDGDIFQVVLSRTKVVPCADEPLDVYKRLRELNPSPYMFYIHSPHTILLGSSPEVNLRVSGTEERVFARRFRIVSRIPPTSPAATRFTYRRSNATGCLRSASENVEPPSTSRLTSRITFLKPLLSWFVPRISRHWTSGTPASIMVANWRVKMTRSFSLTFGLGAFFSMSLARKPPLRPSASCVTESTVIFSRRSWLRTSCRLLPSIVWLIFLPDSSRTSILNLGILIFPPERILSSGSRLAA